ncbi:mucin-16 [Sceloporus undulatus]|uniref:mucin-16 n=1 Tax=Sceloporus undulatus TaxID=8520 RepID=UPI001C4DA21A|nr:mucin-16 [Sceloporus undulatus]
MTTASSTTLTTLPTLTTTPTPAVEQFTVNFTITNLRYREEMGTPNSKVFNATEIAVTTLMDQILKSGSIGSIYLRCKVTSLRPVKDREETGMDSICTYQNDSITPVFDRVKVYHEIVNRTQGFTRMGPYKLERYSLYVNGYHEVPLEATVSPTPPLAVEQFTVNFTVTNLQYKPEMAIPNSKVFNATEAALITLLGRYLNRSSIGPAFLGCEVTTLRRLKNGDQTGMDSVCSYRNDSTVAAFNRVKVYHEIVNQTKSFTQMGPYKLERYSLYVNDYYEVPVAATVLPTLPQTRPLEVDQFTVNFTITNLKYKQEMGTPNSKAFSATEMVVTTLLGRILPHTSIGPAYLGCRVTNMTSVRSGDETGIDSVCTYRDDSTAPAFDRVKVYHEIVNRTKGFTKMGPYNLERYSLYVNATQTPTTEHFTVNFTVTNLRYKPEMGIPNSKAFNATEMTLTTLLGRMFNRSSVGPGYMGCQVTRLRPIKNGDETGMDSVCVYRNNAAMSIFDRVKVYHELRNKTNGFTKMGPYKLDPNSLYVNDYNEAPVQTTVLPKTTPMVEHFTMNFTITNLRYKPEMGIPNSKTFGATEMALTTLLGRMLSKSSVIGPRYLGCRLTTLRPIKHGDETGMDSICTCRKDSTSPIFDRVKVYHEIVNKTNGFTKMGPYKLDPDSLYVNDYNEPPMQTTVATPTKEHFTVNFTVTNLRYKPEMGVPNSKAFNATEMTLTTLLGRMFNRSTLGPAFGGCEVTALRPKKHGDETGMDSICTYQTGTTIPIFDRVKVYQEMVNKTSGFTKMGPYKLDPNSLYVNGYNKPSSLSALSPMTTATKMPTLGYFTVNYTLSSLPYTMDMGIAGSRKFNATERVVKYLVESFLNKTSVGPALPSCKVQSFRSPETGAAVMVDQLCSYRKDQLPVPFDRVRVYDELRNLTKDGTKFGHIAMKKDSLCVNGYPPSSLVPEGFGYELGFTIVNENLTNTDPSSPEYRQLEDSIKDQIRFYCG